MPCAAIDRAAIRFTGDEADVCIFSFKLVLELVIKEKSQLCPSVTVNQKENRIPLQLCFVSCGVLAPPSPEEFILSLDSVEKCVEQCHCVAASFELLALTIPHLYVSDKFYVGVCFLIS